MDYNIAIEEFEQLDDDQKAKTIYAHFGLAVYIAQVLEQQAINMIVVSKQSKKKFNSRDQVDELWNNYYFGSRTFGILVNEITQNYQLSESDNFELKALLKLRNHIAHDYFRLNSELFFSESGQRRMIKDFVEFRSRAKSMDSILKDYMKVYTDKIGLTDEKINEMLEQMISESQATEYTEKNQTIKK
jgi:hypothetical protein